MHKDEQQYGSWMRATMERFFKSLPMTNQGATMRALWYDMNMNMNMHMTQV